MTARPSPPCYSPPLAEALVAKDDVHAALDFLIRIEPVTVNSKAEYQAATAPFRDQIAGATATLRRFGTQIVPLELATMQAVYYGFTNAPRYLRSGLVSSVVTTALTQAWHEVGPWRR